MDARLKKVIEAACIPVVKKEVPGIEVRPVLDERGFVILYDLYVAGKWVGSRRTEKQCEEWLSFLCCTPIEACAGSPW